MSIIGGIIMMMFILSPFLALVGQLHEWLPRTDHIPTSDICASSAVGRHAHINTDVRDAEAWDVNL